MIINQAKKKRKKNHTKTMHLLTISYKDMNSATQDNQIINWSLGTKQTQEFCFQSTIGSEDESQY